MRASISRKFSVVLLRILEIVALLGKNFFALFVPKSWRFKDIKGEIAVVTGAGSGLGRLLAVELARRNAVVVLWDVNASGNEETQRIIKEEGGTSYAYHCDVSDPDQVYATAKKVKEQVGVVTVLFNNAGILVGQDFMDIPDAKIRKTFEINSMGPMWTCKAFLPDMMDNNHGHIVNVASMGGLLGFPKLTDYGASKFALVGFNESLTIELYLAGYDGIRTTLACPNFFRSGLYKGFSANLLMKDLSVHTVCREIIAAFLVDDMRVLIPWSATLPSTMKPWIPAEVGMRLMRLLGLYEPMKKFVGARPLDDKSTVVPDNNRNYEADKISITN